MLIPHQYEVIPGVYVERIGSVYQLVDTIMGRREVRYTGTRIQCLTLVVSTMSPIQASA